MRFTYEINAARCYCGTKPSWSSAAICPFFDKNFIGKGVNLMVPKSHNNLKRPQFVLGLLFFASFACISHSLFNSLTFLSSKYTKKAWANLLVFFVIYTGTKWTIQFETLRSIIFVNFPYIIKTHEVT